MKFVIIGCGSIAHRHAANIAKGGELVAVCDIVEEKADRFAGEHHATAYYSLEDLLTREKHIDVAVICTPNYLHAPQSIACLRAGFHALCEKPMALNVADATAMMQAAVSAGRTLAIVKQNRYNPPVQLVRQLIDSGTLGSIQSVHLSCCWNRDDRYYEASDWKGRREKDGGILYTQFSHFIDLLYWYCGEVEVVTGFSQNFQHANTIEGEDAGAVALRFASGAIGTFHYTVNSFEKNMEGALTITGDKGTVKIGGEYLNLLEYCRVQGYTAPVLPESGPANQYGSYTGSMSNHGLVYDNLLSALQHGAALTTTPEDASKTVEIIEKIYKVIRS